MRELSEREKEVWRLVAMGNPNKVIARQLDLSEATVKVYVRTINKIVQTTNRTKLAIKYFQANPGFVDELVI